ncbi:lectin C-type domain protein [Oesophagostomum dentatum]|uniref:Lectin C-type domain protein n=1 Tax=Oesophagostomum dentatum TaxID=61180 RepID=A0A0B1S9A1_OESDE|nr:lectin C-type domain protein [Oesophagostomum dentatum]
MLLFLAALIVSIAADCPFGTVYHQEFNRCYKFVSDPQPFYLAEEACISSGGHVVSVSNGYDKCYAYGYEPYDSPNHWKTALSEKLKNPFIGLNELSSATWSWSDGSNSTYLNWATGQPSSTSTCALLNITDGTWTGVSCNTASPYICAFVASVPGPTCPPCPTPAGCPSLPPVIGHCDSGWAYFDKTDSCYKYFLWATFDNAEMVCMSTGGHLASIHSDEENVFVADISKAGVEYKKDDDLTWIGLKQKDYPSSPDWTWTDGTPLDYKNWAPSQPDDKKGREHCAQTHSDYLGRNPAKDTSYQHWNDCECTLEMRAYVCKKPASH